MKRLTVLVLALSLFAVEASAQLVKRGPSLVYDETLNITWLRDANLALTNHFDVPDIRPDGSMTWHTALAWIDALNATNYLGYSDWRLPKIEPIGAEYTYHYSLDGTSDYGMGITSPNSELAYMFSVNLQNYGGLVDDPKNSRDESLFINLGCADPREFCPTAWSGNRYFNPSHPEWPDSVWVFDMSLGIQSGDYTSKYYYVWPVRDGDSARGGGRRQ